MKRDQAREKIKAAGITCENVTRKQLLQLWSCLNDEMINSGCYHGSLMMLLPPSKFMECRSDSWPNREAVSFNDDGFVGIAGWADSENVKPFLKGIDRWLKSEPTPTETQD